MIDEIQHGAHKTRASLGPFPQGSCAKPTPPMAEPSFDATLLPLGQKEPPGLGTRPHEITGREEGGGRSPLPHAQPRALEKHLNAQPSMTALVPDARDIVVPRD